MRRRRGAVVFLVLRCPACGFAKVAREGVKRTPCAHCGKGIETSRAAVLLVTPDPGEARLAAGGGNARKAGRMEEFREAVSGAVVARPPPSGPVEAAVRAAASARGEEARVEAAARAFSVAKGAFTAVDFEPVLEALAVGGSALERLERLAAVGVLFEPRPGVFSAA